MSKVLEDQSDSELAPAPAPAPSGVEPAVGTDSAAALLGVSVAPASKTHTLNSYWKPKPSDIPALSVLLGTLIVALIFLALVIALVGNNGAGSSRSSSSMVSQMGGQTSNQRLYPVDASKVPAHQTYNAAVPAAPAGPSVTVTLAVQETLLSIAPDVAYHAWTFNGTVPGPVIRVRQGQTVNFTLVNKGTMPHSIDFHAAQTPWNVNYQAVPAGKSFSFNWKANYPGVFMYHCGTPPVMFHMANGMYGAIIVDPATGWSPAQEYVLVQSEFYTRQSSDGSYGIDGAKLMSGQPDVVVFNGYADQYKAAPLAARTGQKVRLFIVNAGPSRFSAFHVIGALFSDVYLDGNPANHTVGNQTFTIPPGGGAVAELTMPDAGLYPFVTHSFMDASIGATGVIAVTP
jgi:nitrite reductase (NO-forming)